jgi:hypothetical protein
MKSTLGGIIFIIIFFAAIAGGGYYLLSSSSAVSGTPSPKADATSMPPASLAPASFTREVPPGFKEFQSQPLHFSILYPENLSFKRTEGKGNTTTLVFEDVAKAQGFQIFITPYNEPQVSEAQFKKDLPSGVRKNLTSAIIDSTTAATFNSVDKNLGDTYEVWFLSHGWLYEITTLKPLTPWLQDILKTWKFF